MSVIVKTDDELRKIEVAGKILARVLQKLADVAQEGIIIQSLDALAKSMIEQEGATPSFLGYTPEGATRPYPSTLCASLNEVVVHAVPTRRRLKSGDILKIDLGVCYQGYNADAAVTVGIGEISEDADRLIRATRLALERAISETREGNTLGDIGYAIAKTAKEYQCSVIQGLTGHGIGRTLHEEPSVSNDWQKGKGMKLVRGMAIAIEPMFSLGSPNVVQRRDESYATVDGSLTAHFEHTVVLGARGAKVVTQSS